MAFNAQPGERYTIRRKVLKIFGAAFHVYDPQGALVAYCKQKAFKLREDIRLFTDESMNQPLLVIKARSMMDFSTVYDVTTPQGQVMGSLRRKGLKSTFVRDTWLVFDRQGQEIAKLQELGSIVPVLRRFVDYVSLFFPQKYDLTAANGTRIAHFRQHFNPFVYRLGVSVVADDAQLDDLVILAAGSLIAAIEGRQG